MLKKRLISCMLITGLLTSGIAVRAEEPCDYDYFINSMIKLSDNLGSNDKIIEIPEEYKSYNKIYIKAAEKGIVKLDELEALNGTVSKQDAVNILYRVLTEYDASYEISEKEAEGILNKCYDNGYLKPENKLAYAAMIKYGVIGTNGRTEPDKVLTKDSLKLLEDKMLDLFSKRLPVSVNGVEISVGSSADEVFARFGAPDRIDENEYGFKWYVYNKYYSDFIMIGVKDNVVCAYFTNSKNLEFDGLKKGDTQEYRVKEKGLRIIRDKNGAVAGVLYNPYPALAEYAYNEDACKQEFADILNAERIANGMLTFSLRNTMGHGFDVLDAAEKVGDNLLINSDNCFETYENMLLAEEGEKILSYEDINFSIINVDITNAEGKQELWDISLYKSKDIAINLSDRKHKEEAVNTEPVDEIKAPVLVSPVEQEITADGGLTLKLTERAADEYFVKLYNLETESYDVYAYLKSNTEEITIPSYMLNAGNLYRVCVSAVDGGEIIPGNTVHFTYGVCETPVSLVSPETKLSTYDDQIQISAASSAYRDFRIDVYDVNNKVVATKNLVGTNECVLESLPAGKYYVYVTAVSHATGKDMGTAGAEVTIKAFTPVIKEFIIGLDEPFNYDYGDGENWIYLYDEEIIEVTSEVPDTSQLIEGESPQIQTVYKKKITQRKVPATKRYKSLSQIIRNGEFAHSGIHSDTGDAIAALALSYQGVPYLWGGTDPSGFDCSGLVKYVCNALGIKNVARTAAEQFTYSGVFVSKSDLIPGDLVFFQKNGVIHHVGIYIGNNMMVHAPHTGDVVKISDLSDSYYYNEYAGAKRVF